jgi:alpha 1,3-glucosidase
MNEPSVFDEVDMTLPKLATFKYYDSIYYHRDGHNLYGYLMHKTSYDAIKKKYNKRPFLLTRSFYLGSHRYGATWTGDNRSTFHDLKLSISMILNNSISGYSFIGADVGGFVGEAQHFLYYRWYQLGTFYPFFRGHSQNEMHRREPWLYDSETSSYIRNAILMRYKLLPYIYRVFYKSYTTGMPIVQPLWMSFEDKAIDTYSEVEFMFGDSILVRPIVNESEHYSNEVACLLPEAARWYDFNDYKELTDKGEITYKTTNNNIGVFIKGGSVIPMKWRLRRSSKKSKNDSLTLLIALDNDENAKGRLYIDDEETYQHKISTQYILSRVTFNNNILTLNNLENNYVTKIYIERIIIIGLRNNKVSNIYLNNANIIDHTNEPHYLILNKLKLSVSDEWTISLNYNKEDL